VLADLLLEAAPREMLLQRLGGALAQTSRQVNTLERRIAPELKSRVAAILRTLDELNLGLDLRGRPGRGGAGRLCKRGESRLRAEPV
jgi:hypothetical protein